MLYFQNQPMSKASRRPNSLQPISIFDQTRRSKSVNKSDKQKAIDIVSSGTKKIDLTLKCFGPRPANIPSNPIINQSEIIANIPPITPKDHPHLDKILTGSKGKPERSEGLPNILSNCFLNSVVQLLYAAKQFREKLHQISKDRASSILRNGEKQSRSLVFVSQLAQIFSLIEQHGSFEQKGKALRKLLESIGKVNETYEFGKQHDAFDICFTIIQKVMEECPDLKQYFQVRYKSFCKCRVSYIEVCNVQAINRLCFDCQKDVQTRFMTIPIFLVVQGMDSSNCPLRLTYETQNRKHQMVYELRSVCVYTGDGISGHYMAVRKKEKEQNAWLHLNDSRETSLSELDFARSEKITIFLYEHVKTNAKPGNEQMQILESKTVDLKQQYTAQIFILSRVFQNKFEYQKVPISFAFDKFCLQASMQLLNCSKYFQMSNKISGDFINVKQLKMIVQMIEDRFYIESEKQLQTLKDQFYEKNERFLKIIQNNLNQASLNKGVLKIMRNDAEQPHLRRLRMKSSNQLKQSRYRK